MNTKFEYLVIKNPERRRTIQGMTTWLNEMGQDGWLLVQRSVDAHMDFDYDEQYVFVREKRL